MQRVKLALVALAGVLALTGCQADPNQAARVGDVTIDNAQVDAAVARIEADLEKNEQALPKESYGDVRQVVVEFTVFNEIARRYAQEKGVSVPARDYDQAAAEVGLPADDPYTRLYADASAYRTALVEKAQPVTPTEADLQAAYRRYAELAGAQAASYDEVKPELAKLTELRAGLGLRNELMAAADRYGLVVNPRYAPLEVPLTSLSNGQLVLVTLPLGDQGTGAVRDV